MMYAGGMQPRLEAVILCDAFYREPQTGKLSLLGIFHHIDGPAYPLSLAPVCVYVAISGVRGSATLQVRVVRLESDGAEVSLGEGELAVSTDHPAIVAEIPLILPELIFDEPGDHRIRIESGGDVLGERRLQVGRMEDLL